MKGSSVLAVLTGLLLAYTGLRLIGLAIKRATHRAVRRAANLRVALTLLTTGLAIGFAGVALTR